ncbi:MAG: AAA family ATPase [Candidatus Rokubacteria bacterium]|nr:AAA family ATPase [Candidatus Rokubacteria bacterium]
MQCSRCASDNPATNRFCDQCGAPLEQRCPRCGAALRPNARFCGGCGAALAEDDAAARANPAAPASAPARRGSPTFRPYTPKHLADKILNARSALEGERRQVTVLFADLAGFTALAERLDPEEVHRILDTCFALITDEVHRFEGTINQYTGDGVMALFGAPIAHEDSPRRAVHAALGMQRAIRRYARELADERGITLAMRVGLNTGPVVVGRIGDDLRMDYTAVGDTTNLAARMQQIARPGSVVVTEATHRGILGFFETLDLEEVAVKGHSPVRAFEVVRPRGQRSRLDVAVERGLTRYVGRAPELALLRDRFAEAKAGHGQVVFVQGEAGMGKSRLLLELRRALAQQGEEFTWLEGQCISFGQSVPYLPIIDQLRKNFGIEEFDGEPEIIAKVEHGARRLGQLEAHTPFLRYLLAADPGDPAIGGMDAAARRQRIFAAIRALTLRGASIRPLVLVFEDLHWMDSNSEEYLTATMDSVAAARVMLILTYRIGYTPPFGARSFHTVCMLTPVSEAETMAIATSVLGVEALPAELRDALMAKAEGVPLFIEEVTRTLLDLGVLRRDGEGYRFVKGLSDASVPETIQGIIMARLDRLGEEGKRTVQLASVIGRQFLVRLLGRVGGMADRLERLLEELKALEIFYEQHLVPEPAYVFKHAIIQDVAYNSLLRERRKDLHRAVGLATEELYGDRLAEHYEELAHHFVNGEQWDRAFEYLVRSGDRARDAYSNKVALDLYARALDVAPRVAPALAPQRLLEVYQRRSEVWRALANYPEAIAESERMLTLARDVGDRAAEGQALVDLALAHWLTFSSDHVPEARRYAEAAIAIAREIGDERVVAKATTYLGLLDQIDGNLVDGDEKLVESLAISEAREFRDSVAQNLVWLGAHANWRGEFARAVDMTRRAEEVAKEIHDGFQELFALAFRSLALVTHGEYAEGLAVIAEGLAKARERNNPFILGRLVNTRGWFHQEFGDFRGALEYDRESADHGRRIKNPNVEISALINLAFDQMHLGQLDQALPLLEDTQTRVDKFAFGAHRWRWGIHVAAYLAEALLARGEPEQALVQADQGLVRARATGSLKYVARFHAVRGAIALAMGDAPSARSEAAAGLRIAREIGYPTLVWQAAHLLARTEAATAPAAAHEHARLAADTIAWIAERAPAPELRASLLAWPEAQAALGDAERLRG